MRLGRFLFFLALIFFAAYWWAGGNMLVKQMVPAMPEAKPSFFSDESSWLGKTVRLVYLKSAVEAKINKKNQVALRQVPISLQQAVIAIEDNRFYSHIGIDIEGILRAILVNIQKGSIVEGGSTITQQLVKNLFLTQEQTVERKVEEALLAIDLELRYSKEEILEMYLSTIFFGANSYGIKDAAQNYFAKTPSELNLAESALLAGLPNGPSIYSPYVNLNAAKQRQALVLNAMVRNGYIGPMQAQEAKSAPLKLAR
ncbi:MAG: mtgA 1 [Firmicutes bacterium]|nr:mtgA 1 [Bacillota bacterium]